MADSAGERSERATPKRRREARKRGQVARSRELTTAAVLGAAVLALTGSAHATATAAMALMRSMLTLDAASLAHPEAMAHLFGHDVSAGIGCVVPVMGATIVGALAGSLVISGWNFSIGAIKPDFSRLNPLSGIGRMFSGTALFELLKGLLKALWIGLIAGTYLWRQRSALAGLSNEPAPAAIAHGTHILAMAFAWMAGALFVIAAFDAPYQLWSYSKRMRMTRQEVRDEHKQSEGRPEVKARIRRLQQAMAKRRMVEKIPQADVVVTNPTHYAVALQYKGASMRAPRVLAKGAGEIAAVIRELASEHHIPTVSAPPLARALYRGVEIDAEIPGELYAAVARVLTYVYQLKGWQGGRRPEPPAVEDVPGGEPDPESPA